jgi:hypothetical protein
VRGVELRIAERSRICAVSEQRFYDVKFVGQPFVGKCESQRGLRANRLVWICMTVLEHVTDRVRIIASDGKNQRAFGGRRGTTSES